MNSMTSSRQFLTKNGHIYIFQRPCHVVRRLLFGWGDCGGEFSLSQILQDCFVSVYMEYIFFLYFEKKFLL